MKSMIPEQRIQGGHYSRILEVVVLGRREEGRLCGKLRASAFELRL